jgi:phospholipid/cholesterol/gamma-HCH transport system substrate-binding protein
VAISTRFSGFRYTHEAVGALVLVTVLIFVMALMKAGHIREWFDPAVTVRVILPAEGVFGLTEGARVEILGTKAGDVRKIVLDPNQTMHAEIFVRNAMLAFVRRDSQAIIRKQFGVAGASYLEITRGNGAPLDKEYAVLTAIAERAPTDAASELIAEIRNRVLPIIEDSQAAIQAFTALAISLQGPISSLQPLLTDLNTITGRLERGEGSVGRLLTEDTLARELETLLDQAGADMQRLGAILTALAETARHAATLTATLNKYAGGIPQLAKRVDAILVPLQGVLEDLRQTTPELPRLTKGMADTTEGLPLLLLQTEQSLDSLEKLLRQLRSHWLLGGRRSDATQDSSRRLPALDITP